VHLAALEFLQTGEWPRALSQGLHRVLVLRERCGSQRGAARGEVPLDDGHDRQPGSPHSLGPRFLGAPLELDEHSSASI
jgi:hypothetical protein